MPRPILLLTSLLTGLCALLALPAQAATPNAPNAPSALIVDLAGVDAAREARALIWDVRPAEAYRQGHLPGAVNIGDAPTVLRDATTEDFIETPRIAALLGAAGIDPAREIVVYGQRGGWQAYFGLYALQYFGAKRVHVYHDGFEGWTAAGRRAATGVDTVAPVALTLHEDAAAQVSIDTAAVVAKLRRPDVQILDVRTPGEFSGEDVRAIRGGHIPGARNIPYEQNWVDPDAAAKAARREPGAAEGMALKPQDALRALYADLDPDKETIVYCQSGARASETAGVLQSLGFRKVRVYDASWLGYGNTLDAPADSVRFLNVGQLNARIAALQARIEQLEKAQRTAAGAAR